MEILHTRMVEGPVRQGASGEGILHLLVPPSETVVRFLTGKVQVGEGSRTLWIGNTSQVMMMRSQVRLIESYSLIHFFLQQIFIEDLLCAGHCSMQLQSTGGRRVSIVLRVMTDENRPAKAQLDRTVSLRKGI